MHPFNFGSFAAASLRHAHSFLPHSTGSSLHSQPLQQQQLKTQLHARLRMVAAAAAAATAGTAGMHLYRQGKPGLQQGLKPTAKQSLPTFLIPKELAEVIAGAFAEIVQVAALYPLDTIKVRCQAAGLPVSGVVKQLLASPGTAVAQLYAGVVSASLASVVVGSLYFFTFCAAKRSAMKMVAEAEQKHRATQLATPTAGIAVPLLTDIDSSSTSRMLHVQQQIEAHVFPHGAGADYHYDPVFAAICSDDAAAKATAAAAAAAATPQNATTSSSSTSSTVEVAEPSSQGRLQANMLAACAAALVGAVAEAPMELFKHRAQVGQIQGSMLGAMVKALHQQGPRALYGSFFLPFCFKSLPFDMAELITYSSLQDWKQKASAVKPPTPTDSATVECTTSIPQQQRQQQQQPVLALGSITATSQLMPNSSTSSSMSHSSALCNVQQMLNNTPEHIWDMAAGAAAGAAAVLVSMPADCIKTVLETGGGVPAKPGSGVLGSAAAFAATGKLLVLQRGVAGGLFMGLAPRLVESVPSTMMYWVAVEAARRLLEPYTAK